MIMNNQLCLVNFLPLAFISFEPSRHFQPTLPGCCVVNQRTFQWRKNSHTTSGLSLLKRWTSLVGKGLLMRLPMCLQHTSLPCPNQAKKARETLSLSRDLHTALHLARMPEGAGIHTQESDGPFGIEQKNARKSRDLMGLHSHLVLLIKRKEMSPHWNRNSI